MPSNKTSSPQTVILTPPLGQAQSAPVTIYRGMAEPSAAAMLDACHFVAAHDEGNTLLVYALDDPDPVGKPVDLAEFLDTGEKASDIEAGARVGDSIYWISSHSLPKSGKSRDWRKRFFATKLDLEASPPTVRGQGRACADLLDDMIAAPELRDLRLEEASRLPPERKDGLNIEGLATWKNDGLLIGFRAPLRAGKAAVVPFTNPASVVKGGRAAFDAPIFLDLGGRGIRSIEWVEGHYLIAAGPVGDDGNFAIYRWTGKAGDAPVMQFELPSDDFTPEVLLATPEPGVVTLLSDDGSSQPDANGVKKGKTRQQFRAMRLKLP